jgi:hypothetical protein
MYNWGISLDQVVGVIGRSNASDRTNKRHCSAAPSGAQAPTTPLGGAYGVKLFIAVPFGIFQDDEGSVLIGLVPHESITETPDPPAEPFQQGHKGWPIGIFPRRLDCQLFVGDVGRAHCRDHT